MDQYIAFEAPAWSWILACFALLFVGIAFGLGAAVLLRLAARSARDRKAIAEIHARLAAVEEHGAATERDYTLEARVQADRVAITAKIPVVWPRDDEQTETMVSAT